MEGCVKISSPSDSGVAYSLTLKKCEIEQLQSASNHCVLVDRFNHTVVAENCVFKNQYGWVFDVGTYTTTKPNCSLTLRNCTFRGISYTTVIHNSGNGQAYPNVTLENNIFYAQSVDSAANPLSFWTGVDSFTSLNNLFYSDPGTWGMYYDGTVYSSLASWKTAVGDTTSIEGDPLFTNYSTGDLTLSSTDSPAYDAGYNNGLTEDLLSVSRPQGSAIDIGAYEYYIGGGFGGTPLLCWTLTGQHKKTGRVWSLSGPDKFPGFSGLELPDLMNISVIEDGKKIV